jgi:hypothetical protein
MIAVALYDLDALDEIDDLVDSCEPADSTLLCGLVFALPLGAGLWAGIFWLLSFLMEEIR